ncbi:unnamed protein product, partial [Laminaria digitata]
AGDHRLSGTTGNRRTRTFATSLTQKRTRRPERRSPRRTPTWETCERKGKRNTCSTEQATLEGDLWLRTYGETTGLSPTGTAAPMCTRWLIGA